MVSTKITRHGSGRVVSIMGATATGKTDLAIQLAEKFAGEIVSMDSRQIYRGLDIGTAKPTPEQRARVPHHLLDVLDPDEKHSAGRHLRMVIEAVDDIRSRGKLPLLVGGTGLYFRVFFDGLIEPGIPEHDLTDLRERMASRSTQALYAELLRHDPERARDLSPNDRVRITRALEIYQATGTPHSRHIQAHRALRDERPRWPRVFLSCERDRLRKRIAKRTEAMYRAGWIAEVRGLLAEGYALDAPAMNSLGYRAIAKALLGGADPEATRPRVVTLTQQYAKRQETFFRSVPGAERIDIEADRIAEKTGALIEAALRL